MKTAMPLSDREDDSSSDESSALDTDSDDIDRSSKSNNKRISMISRRSSKEKITAGDSVKQKSRGIDFEALSRHGYKGGLSVLNVPPPKVEEKHDWSWSTGRERSQSRVKNDTEEETFEERERTRAALSQGEQLTNVQTKQKEKNLSFSHKEKRKRDLGQASRGKSYVEEEKRLLRDSGIYSGFDS